MLTIIITQIMILQKNLVSPTRIKLSYLIAHGKPLTYLTYCDDRPFLMMAERNGTYGNGFFFMPSAKTFSLILFKIVRKSYRFLAQIKGNQENRLSQGHINQP